MRFAGRCRLLSAALLSGAFLAACGPAEKTQLQGEPALRVMHAQSLHMDSNDECVALLEAILDDAAMLQQTPAFRALEKTEAFQAVLTDEQELDNNHCNDHPTTAGCKALFQIAERDREIMARTPEYQAMTRTPEYRTLAAHIANAQSAGCISATTSLF